VNEKLFEALKTLSLVARICFIATLIGESDNILKSVIGLIKKKEEK